MENEKRLIDVWDVIEWLDNFDMENTLRILRGKKAKLLNSHEIKNMIVTVPRVDAVEVVHGKWEIRDDGYGCELMCCSVCKSEFYDGDNDTVDCLHNYCPNCGAKMDGDENA